MEKIYVDIEEKKEYFKSIAENTGWDPLIDDWLSDYNFTHVVNYLINQVNDGRRFTPRLKDILNGLILCPYKETKVLFIGQDPYPQLDVSDGILFSCSRQQKPEKSLEFIFKALYGDSEDKDYDLSRWSKQGVIMLSTALTVEINSIGSHYSIWKPFMNMLFSHINDNFENIAVVLLGKKAEEWEIYFSNQKIFKVTHPASAAYKNGIWDHKDIFNQINLHLNNVEKNSIIW